MTTTQILGFVGTGLVIVGYIPQVVHLIKERCTAGISVAAFSLWCAASLLFLIHAAVIRDAVFVVVQMRGVNYFCRSTTTISAGEGLAKERRWRPQRNSVIVAGRSRAMCERCFLLLDQDPMMAVGARGKPSAVFQGPVGAFCASTGPAASTASFSVRGSVIRPVASVDSSRATRAFDLASGEQQVDLQAIPDGDRRS